MLNPSNFTLMRSMWRGSFSFGLVRENDNGLPKISAARSINMLINGIKKGSLSEGSQ